MSLTDAELGRGARGPRLLLGALFAIAALLTAASVALGASPSLSGPLGPASPLVLSLSSAAFVLLVALATILATRLYRLAGRRSEDAGARLHLRFVTLFAAVALAPAVIVALFFGALVTRSVDSWFSARVQTVVENSAVVAKSYVEDQKDQIGRRVAVMAGELNAGAASLRESPLAYGRFLRQLVEETGFLDAYVLDHDGRVLARADASGPVAPFLAPPPDSFRAADEGDVVSVGQFESSDMLRGLYRLRGYPEAYLYVTRPLGRGIFRHLRETEASLQTYRMAKARRLRIEAAFAFSYLETVLLVLVGAVWLGMEAANGIAGPVARLVQAAGRVSAGDLTARVDTRRDPEEIAVLSRAFNRMTADLQQQQDELRQAHAETDSRRQFSEAVLLGVSAGVLGVDGTGRVSVANRPAATLLGLQDGDWSGRPLTALAPEMEPLVTEALSAGVDIEGDIDVVRGGQTRRLRARASPGAEGLVLTFDDITGLVAAQRNAAWRDVARRIAHEIKNPLTPIQLSAERLKRRFRRDVSTDVEIFDRCVDTIVRQVGDIGRMVDEFSAFARMPAPKFAPHDAVELAREAMFTRRVADPAIEIDYDGPAGPIPLMCDGAIIGQALTNVLKNAQEAISARPNDGEPPPKGLIQVRLTQTADRLAYDIIDNGVGLPVVNRDRLTEPYVTTREKGTGLGLAIVRRILEEHGGGVTLADAPGGTGAWVTLWFKIGARDGAVAGAEMSIGKITA